MANWGSLTKQKESITEEERVGQSDEISKQNLINDIYAEADLDHSSLWVSSVLSGKVDPFMRDMKGDTVLHFVVELNEYENAVKLLNCIPVDTPNVKGETPLMVASSIGSFPLIKLFLDRGADLESSDAKGQTPLFKAVANNELTTFLILVHRGADIYAKDEYEWTLVHVAAYRNNTKFLRVLKSFGLNLDTIDEACMTPLHRAAMSNAMLAVDWLLEEGMEKEVEDDSGRTPARIANEQGSEGSEYILQNFTKNKDWKYFYPILVAVEVMLWCFYVKEIVWYTAHNLIVSLGFTASGLLLVPFLVWIKISPPGNLPKKSDDIENELIKSIGEEFEKENFSEIVNADKICFTCFVVKPVRSKHCRICDNCVPGFDHHCSFLGKCISLQNKKVFTLALSVFYFELISYLYLIILMLSSKLGETTEFWSTYISQILVTFLAENKLFILSVIFVGIIAWYLHWYLFLVLYSITKGSTINELLNRHKYRYLFEPDPPLKTMRYKNPFNKGVIRNWIDFITKF